MQRGPLTAPQPPPPGGTAGGAFGLQELEQSVRGATETPRLQYQYLRALLVALRACAAGFGAAAGLDAAAQRALAALVSELAVSQGRDECAGALAECLGALCELPGLQVPLDELLGAPLRDQEHRERAVLALSAARHAITQVNTGAAAERGQQSEVLARLESILPDLLAAINDDDVYVAGRMRGG